MLCVAVGDGPLEFAEDVLRLLQKEDAALGDGFAHLGVRLVQAHDPGPLLGDVGLRHPEDLAIDVVEAVGNVPADLHMLLLVLPHRDEIRLVEQDIGGHQAGVGEEAGVDVVGVLGRLVLELGHAGELPEHGVAIQHPAQLRVGGHMALDEDRVLLRVQAAGDIDRDLGQGAPAQVRRVLTDRDGVQVRHEPIAFKLV